MVYRRSRKPSTSKVAPVKETPTVIVPANNLCSKVEQTKPLTFHEQLTKLVDDYVDTNKAELLVKITNLENQLKEETQKTDIWKNTSDTYSFRINALKDELKKNRKEFESKLFWQTVASIVIGIATGVTTVLFILL